MKTKLIISILMILTLIACGNTETSTNTQIQEATLKENMSFDEALNYLDALDKEYNSSWKKEQIPTNMIRPEILGEITNKTLELEKRIEKDTPQSTLVQARLDMISAQTAYYLVQKIGGTLNFTKENGTLQVKEPIDCNNIETIAKSTKLQYMTYQSWNNFMQNMDTLLQKNKEARYKIGINDQRISFYDSPFGKYEEMEQYFQTINQAAQQQCGKTIKLENS